MLDRVSTAVIALDGEGGAGMFADYSQWELAQRKPEKSASKAKTAAPIVSQKKRLSYLEQREWESMEARILGAEQTLETKKVEMHLPAIVSDGARLHQVYEEMLAAQAAVDELYARWAELGSRMTE